MGSRLSALDLEAVLRSFSDLLLFVFDANNVFVDYRFGDQTQPFVPPKQFLGRRILDVLPEHPGLELDAAMTRARSLGEEQQVEYSLPMPGGVRSYQARLVPMGGGRIATLVFEVSDRIRAASLLESRLRRQAAVAALGQRALRGDALQALLDEAVGVVADVLDVELCKILEVAPGGTTLRLRAGVGWRPGLVGHAEVGADLDSQAGLTLRSAVPIIVQDLATESRFRGPPLLREHQVVSGISVVIGGVAEPFGVIGAHARQRRTFAEDDVVFLQSVATILGQAVERERAATALRVSEERFRALIERSSDLIGLLDAEGRFRFVSAAAESLLGRRSEELVGVEAMSLVHPDDRETSAATLGQLLATPGKTVRLTQRLLHADGSVRVHDSSGANFLHLPAIQGLVINSRDITEQRRLEQQLGESQRLESIGRLAGGIAHDFNNLLTAIMGSAELLQAESGPRGKIPEVDDIIRSVDRAKDLVQQLLAFARKQVLAPQVLDLNAVVSDIGRLTARLVGDDIAVRTILGEGLAPVRADPAQLEQVIMNLVVNAKDAMPAGGVLTIETANADVDRLHVRRHPSDMQPGRYVVLSVSDTGSGIAPDVVNLIFEPFFTTKAPGVGTGLGLATVYGIVKQSGGYIWVSSEPGLGSTFKIYLPRVQTAVVTPVEPQADGQLGGSETILLVEDDVAVRSVAERLLRNAGYRVLSAPSGKDALALDEEYGDAVHLLVTDVVMPGLSGIQVAETFGKRRPGVPVLYLSGYAEGIVTHHGVGDPTAAFLAKPFTNASLLGKVRDALGGQ